MDKKFVLAGLLLASLGAMSTDASAQASVESRPIGQAQPAGSTPVASSPDQAADLFYRLQAMQQELLELRGLVEEQAYEINRLKQQRHDDYMDLDRRISALTGKPATAVPAPDVGGDDGSGYKDAYAKLRDRDLQGARLGFSEYLKTHPKGKYAANSQYWLGEIALVDGKPDQARIWFEKVVVEFPEDRKAPDAQYKLGTVLFQLGDKDRARKLLQQVADSQADAARLAREFLAANY